MTRGTNRTSELNNTFLASVSRPGVYRVAIGDLRNVLETGEEKSHLNSCNPAHRGQWVSRKMEARDNLHLGEITCT